MPSFGLVEDGSLLPTDVDGKGTPRRKTTSDNWFAEIWDNARDFWQTNLSSVSPVGHGAHESLSVRMHRAREQVRYRRLLNDAAGVHYDHALACLCNNA